MTQAEIVNWLLFAFVVASGLAVYYSYGKTEDIIHPPKKAVIGFTPDQYKLAYETIDFATSDGVRLRGWFIPARVGDSSRTIIMCHGRASNRGDLLRDTHFLAGLGYNLFYFDFRASGESKGAVSSVGYLETRDFDAAYEFLKTRRPMQAERVGVFGTSMGGSVALYAAAKYPELQCVLAENTFLSYNRAAANWSWRRLQVPYLPFTALTLFFVRRKLKADPEPYSPKYSAPSVKAPAFFIFGGNDDLVTAAEAEELFRLCGSANKRQWTIAGASHGKCAEVGGEVYREKVGAFFAETLVEPPVPAAKK